MRCKACVSGLWSVRMWKRRPSSRYRKWRTLKNAASSSLSNAEYFSCVESSFLLKKARGLHVEPESCCSTAPTCVLLASTARHRSALARLRMSRNPPAVSEDFTVCPVLQSEYGARLVTGRGRVEAAKKEEEERHQRSLLNTFPFK